MPEILEKALQSADEKVARMIEADLNRLEQLITATNSPDYNKIKDVTTRMKMVGEALEALSTGLEAYRAVSSQIKQDAMPPPKP
ncbi:MAG TPA: hypothetical protein VN455_04445 [Methanotrichaceae archaeon]|nr:hypothetical protein [Methanotrichaceae archaeon]